MSAGTRRSSTDVAGRSKSLVVASLAVLVTSVGLGFMMLKAGDDCSDTRRVNANAEPIDEWTPGTADEPKSPEAALVEFLTNPPKAELGGVRLNPDPAAYKPSPEGDRRGGHVSFTADGTSIEAFRRTNCTNCWLVTEITSAC